MSGNTNGAACGDDPGILQPDKFASKIVIKMFWLTVASPVDPCAVDLADRPATAFECLGAVCRADALVCQVIHNLRHVPLPTTPRRQRAAVTGKQPLAAVCCIVLRFCVKQRRGQIPLGVILQAR